MCIHTLTYDFKVGERTFGKRKGLAERKEIMRN